MHYQTLGKTGIEISEISLGTSSLAGVFHPVTEKQAMDAVSEALNIGINYFDSAPLYGNTLAETRLGKALKHIPRDKYILATKVGRFHNDEFDFSAKRVFNSFEESCKRLGTDYIDVYQAHDIDFASHQQIINETLPALWQLKEQGKVRQIGITGLKIEILAKVANNYPLDTLLSFCRGTLVDNRLNQLNELMDDKKIGIINASPLVMGLLTDIGPISWHPATSSMRSAAKEAVSICKKHGVSIEQIAIQESIRQARQLRMSTTLIGSANKTHIKQWKRWLESFEKNQPNLSEELRMELDSALWPIYNKDW